MEKWLIEMIIFLCCKLLFVLHGSSYVRRFTRLTLKETIISPLKLRLLMSQRYCFTIANHCFCKQDMFAWLNLNYRNKSSRYRTQAQQNTRGFRKIFLKDIFKVKYAIYSQIIPGAASEERKRNVEFKKVIVSHNQAKSTCKSKHTQHD